MLYLACTEVAATYTVTLLTSLTHPDGFVCSLPKPTANDGYDFLEFVLQMLDTGYIEEGDVLVSCFAMLC
jgi:hypothetical protein